MNLLKLPLVALAPAPRAVLLLLVVLDRALWVLESRLPGAVRVVRVAPDGKRRSF